MQNKYAARCERCRQLVGAGEGILQKQEGRWLVTHFGDCPEAAPDAEATHPHARLPDVPAGFYAVDFNGSLSFFRVDRPDSGKWEGYRFVARILGGHEPIRIRKEEARAALEAIESAGFRDALARYGQELGICGRCGKTLTDETSREIGLGPYCRQILKS